MATENKFLRLDPNVLLEWVYNDENLKQENYKILHNYNTGIRTYMSELDLNNSDNTMFPVDTVIRKYAQIDTNKYNFLKVENYAGSDITRYDTVRIHLPSNFSFYDDDYKGFYLRIFSYDKDNKNQFELASYFYDDTLSNSDSQINLNESFLFDGDMWGKYITFDIPSAEAVSKQITNNTPRIPSPNSINHNLTKGVGLSQNSPIFIEFAYISSKGTVLGTTSYRLSTPYSTSINNSPDFADVGVSIIESEQGDFFEIYGTYNNDNEEFDDYIDDMISLGRGVRVEFDVSLFEENILMNTQTFVITENFAQNLWYRPIISFSNTTALISVEMRIIDTVDSSQVSRYTSLGLTNNIFKYGKKLSKIDISGAYKPKIYNLKSTNTLSNGSSISKLQDIDLTKVNYPVITDRIKILATSSASRNNTEYKSMGLAEIIINPFDNYIKFLLAEDVESDGTATPYNLSKILENSTLSLIIKNDTLVVEKNIFQETDQNDYENGIVVFKIEENEVSSIRKIAKDNKDWFLVIKSTNTNVRTLLYSGKFVMFDEVSFVDNGSSGGASGFNVGDITDILGNIEQNTDDITDSLTSESNVNRNSNCLIFLNLDADVGIFEDYMASINANIFLKRSGGNVSCGSYVYFVLNLSDALIEDIKIQDGVDEVVVVPFCLGKDTVDTSGVSIDDIRNSVTGFNCDTADRLNQQNNNLGV